jgi:folate-dependent phosphoribosylglycinamide formyltransferase PurN
MTLKRVLFLGSGDYQSRIIKELESKSCVVIQTDEKIFEIDKSIDLVISFGYRFIVDEHVILSSNIPMLNLHISLLPWNRGAHPVFWSFWDNTQSGVSIHIIDKGIDTGPILFQRPVFIDASKESFASAYNKLNLELVDLTSILTEKLEGKPQHGKSTFHFKRNLPSDFSGWNSNIKNEIDRLSKIGFTPYSEELKIIDEIEQVRNRNNINWMNLLRIVAIESPDKLTKIVNDINSSDIEISKLLTKLVNK